MPGPGYFPGADTGNIVAVEQAQSTYALHGKVITKIQQQGPGLDVVSLFFFHINPSDHSHAQTPCLSAPGIIMTQRPPVPCPPARHSAALPSRCRRHDPAGQRYRDETAEKN